MRFINVQGVKLGNMRKAQDWTVTPSRDINNGIVKMQCEKRAVRIDLNTKQAILSDGKGGAYSNSYAYLDPGMGAKVVTVPDDVIEKVKAAIDEACEDYKSGSINLFG